MNASTTAKRQLDDAETPPAKHATDETILMCQAVRELEPPGRIMNFLELLESERAAYLETQDSIKAATCKNGKQLLEAILAYYYAHDAWPSLAPNAHGCLGEIARGLQLEWLIGYVRVVLEDTPVQCSKPGCAYCVDYGRRHTKNLRLTGLRPGATKLMDLCASLHAMRFECSVSKNEADIRLLLVACNDSVSPNIRLFHRRLYESGVLAGVLYNEPRTTWCAAYLRTVQACLGGDTIDVVGESGIVPAITSENWLCSELNHVDPSKKAGTVNMIIASGGFVKGLQELIKTETMDTSAHRSTVWCHVDVDFCRRIAQFISSLVGFKALATFQERLDYFARWDKPGQSLPWTSSAESDNSPAIRGIKFMFVDELGLYTRPTTHARAVMIAVVLRMVAGIKCNVNGCNARIRDMQFNHLFDSNDVATPAHLKKGKLISDLLANGQIQQAFNEARKTELLCNNHHRVWTGRARYASVHWKNMVRRLRQFVQQHYPAHMDCVPLEWTPEHVPYLDVAFRDFESVRRERLRFTGIAYE